MKSKLVLILLIVALILKIPTDIKAQENNNQNIVDPQKVQDIFKNNTQNTDTTFGIVVWDLNTNQKYTLNENEQFEAASLYKLAVMYTLFDLEKKGKLNTNQADIQANLDPMITVSSNNAALYLVNRYTSWDEITKLMKSKGLNQTSFTSSLLLTTPNDVATLLSLINNPQDINPEARSKMIELLKNQTINDRLPALLPGEATVFHKTGELDSQRHDAGIITGSNNSNYIIVIMTKNSDKPEEIKPVMAKISLEIFNLFNTKA